MTTQTLPSKTPGTAPENTKLSARERLLAAADELFYNEGINTVGIDRVIEHAGVAKATLYSAFGSKDELIRAYLERRLVSRKNRFDTGLAERYDNARDRILGVFDLLEESLRDNNYRGCAFQNASTEARAGSPVTQVCDMSRAWVRGMFVDLATEAGATDPAAAAAQLVTLYDGAGVGGRMDRNLAAAATARSIAELVLVAAGVPA